MFIFKITFDIRSICNARYFQTVLMYDFQCYQSNFSTWNIYFKFEVLYTSLIICHHAGCRSSALLTSCMRPFPLCEVMTLRSGLRLLTICVPGEGGDFARTTFPKLLPLDTERRPGEALALM